MKIFHQTNAQSINCLLCILLSCCIAYAYPSHLYAQIQTSVDPFDDRPEPDAALKVPNEYPSGIDAGKMLTIADMIQLQGDHGWFNQTRLQQRQTFIQNTPDIDRYLILIADRSIEQHSPEMFGVLDAISLRTEIDPRIIERYIQRARTLLATKSPTELDLADRDYIRGIVSVLASKPTPENEDLLIQILQFGFRWPVEQALGKVGTARALPAMEKAALEDADYARRSGDESMTVKLKELNDCLTALRTRLVGASTKPANGFSNFTQKNGETKLSANATANADMSASTFWPILMVGSFVSAALLWFLLKRKVLFAK